MAMVRKIMHRISAGPTSQRDVRHQSPFSPNSASASCCPAAIGSFQTEVARDDFQRTTNLLMQGLGGQAMCSQLLVCLGEPLVAVVMELFPPSFEDWISCVAMTASSQELSTEVAAVRWNARMESSSLRSYASHFAHDCLGVQSLWHRPLLSRHTGHQAHRCLCQ